MQSIFIILPCYNEDAAISDFWLELKKELILLSEAKRVFIPVWIDDGSTDETWSRIHSLDTAPGIKKGAIRFVYNFGHQSALQAGCEYVSKHCDFNAESIIILMDSDGQHPVNRIPDLLNAIMQGARHVQMVREASRIQPFFKRLSSNLFYRFFRYLSQIRIPEGAADFRGLRGSVLLNYLKFTESGRFNRGLFYLAERPQFISYQVKERMHGISKYNLRKMVSLAFTGITHFSNRPLIVASLFGTFFGFVVCVGYFSFEFFRLLQGRVFQPGWFTIMAWISMWGMILSFCILLLSVYLGRVFDETKKRPVYLVREEI